MNREHLLTNFLTLFFIFVFASFGYTAPLSSKRLSIEQGLSQSTVSAIAQDAAGYIWLGTADGIDIYDGQDFLRLRHNPDDPGTLSSNYVKTLLVDTEGFIWIGTLGGGLNRYNIATRSFTVYRKDQHGESFISNDIHSLYQARNGSLWIGSAAGVSRYHPENDTFQHFLHRPEDQESLQKGVIRAITETRDGRMWFGSAESGISCLQPASGIFQHFTSKANDKSSLSNDAISALHQDRQGFLWIGTEYGVLNRLDIHKGTFIRFEKNADGSDGLDESEVTSIFEDKSGGLWFGTWSDGLYLFDPVRNILKRHGHSPANPNSLSSDTVISLFEDHSGMLWAGTFDSGVNIINYGGGNFENFGFDPMQKTGLPGKMIWAFAEDATKDIWIGTKKGLSHFDTGTDEFTAYLTEEGKCPEAAESADVRSIVAEEGKLWLGTAGGGLIFFDPATCETRTFIHDEKDATSLSNNHARLLLLDQQQRLWIGTNNGINVLSADRTKFKRYGSDPQDASTLPHHRVRALHQTASGEIWIGTSGGLSRYDKENDRFETITAEEKLLSDNDVRCIFEDQGGILWLATGVGLTRYNPELKTSQFFYEKDGLANNTLYGLLPDGNELWITTNIGLSRFNRLDFTCKNYNVSDGLQSNEFNFNSYLKTRNKAFYIGGVNGFNRFSPQNFGVNVTAPKLHLVINLLDSTNNKSALPAAGLQPIQLQANNHRLIFFATVMHYLNPSRNTYQYTLTGFDSEWLSASAKDKNITYPALVPGEYQFKIRALSSNGIPGEEFRSPTFRVISPLWSTKWAYLLYIASFCSLFVMAMQIRTNSFRKKAKVLEETVHDKTLELHQKNETLEAQSSQLETVLQNMDDFYLRTAHELRTPLTLIRIPAEKLSAQGLGNNQTLDLNVILRATARLQRLIEQMFQAAIHGHTRETGVRTIDFQAVIAPLLHIYAEIAKEKKITFAVEALPSAAITINRQALEDILHNLLSNALKYTPTGGQIEVVLTLTGNETNRLLLMVKDNGIGIDSKSQSKIFDRHYRSVEAARFEPDGVGMGLHIVKQHVEACKGHMSFYSVPGQGSKFSVSLPCQVTLDSFAKFIEIEGLGTAVPVPQDTSPSTNPSKTLLIIEDDGDMRQVLEMLLKERYQLILTGSVSQGLKKVMEHLPDLVLCDVMLPDGSGFDIVQSLKTNEQTSHIPLVFLTALSDFEEKRTGWENGADDYIVKPFSTVDLLLRIDGLLANRQRLQDWYKRKFAYSPDIQQTSFPENTAELRYIEKLETEAMHLIESGSCSLENLAEAMGQSSRTLQRRMKINFGFSYTEYIQSVQFKKARQLLLEGSSVKETAFATGFNDPGYFSKVFRAIHGVSPSLYRNNQDIPDNHDIHR